MNFKFKKYDSAKIKVSKYMGIMYPIWYELDNDVKNDVLYKLSNIVNTHYGTCINLKRLIREEISYNLVKETCEV